MSEITDTVLNYDLHVMINSASTVDAYSKLVMPVMKEIPEVEYPEMKVTSLDNWLSGKQVIQ